MRKYLALVILLLLSLSLSGCITKTTEKGDNFVDPGIDPMALDLDYKFHLSKDYERYELEGDFLSTAVDYSTLKEYGYYKHYSEYNPNANDSNTSVEAKPQYEEASFELTEISYNPATNRDLDDYFKEGNRSLTYYNEKGDKIGTETVREMLHLYKGMYYYHINEHSYRDLLSGNSRHYFEYSADVIEGYNFDYKKTILEKTITDYIYKIQYNGKDYIEFCSSSFRVTEYGSEKYIAVNCVKVLCEVNEINQNRLNKIYYVERVIDNYDPETNSLVEIDPERTYLDYNDNAEQLNELFPRVRDLEKRIFVFEYKDKTDYSINVQDYMRDADGSHIMESTVEISYKGSDELIPIESNKMSFLSVGSKRIKTTLTFTIPTSNLSEIYFDLKAYIDETDYNPDYRKQYYTKVQIPESEMAKIAEALGTETFNSSKRTVTLSKKLDEPVNITLSYIVSYNGQVKGYAIEEGSLEITINK